MLDDRNPSVKSVKDSGETLQKNLKPQEKKAIQNQIAQLDKRWEALNTSAQERAKTLENIMGIAQEFQDKREPLITWLDGVEKKFTSLEPSAMDVDGIENIIGSLEEMERELESKDGQVKQLAAIAKELQNHCKGIIFFYCSKSHKQEFERKFIFVVDHPRQQFSCHVGKRTREFRLTGRKVLHNQLFRHLQVFTMTVVCTDKGRAHKVKTIQLTTKLYYMD